jgi:hypothetical protein
MATPSLPDQVTINWLAECVGMHPSTVKRRTTGLPRDTAGKLNRVQALEAVFISTVETKDGRITTQEAVRQLTVEKALQVRLQNEITRKERIPIEDVLEVNNRIFQSIAGTLKANRDKVLTFEKINEMFAEFRAATAATERLSGSNSALRADHSWRSTNGAELKSP